MAHSRHVSSSPSRAAKIGSAREARSVLTSGLAGRDQSWQYGDVAMKKTARSSRDARNYEARARIAKALAHASRLQMLDLLQQRERTVTELTQAIKADQSTVSKHLSILRNAGLVSSRKAGAASLYYVTCGCLEGFFACLEAAVQQDVLHRLEGLGTVCDVVPPKR